jgi:hypothetical protein
MTRTRQPQTSPRLVRKTINASQGDTAVAADMKRWKIAWAETGRIKLTAPEMQSIMAGLVRIARQRVAALESELLKYTNYKE